MFLTVGITLLVLWLLGFIIFPVVGWIIHLLLVVGIVVILIHTINGKQ